MHGLTISDALTVVWCLLTGAGMICGHLLLVDVRRDRRQMRPLAAADPNGWSLVSNDCRRETWRMVKQTLCCLAVWVPVLFFPPVLHDAPDPLIFETYRALFGFISFGLLRNSYADLRFRHEYRRRRPAARQP